MTKKLWQKDYKLNSLVEDFTVGNDYLLDQRLLKYDCLASMAHAKMLGKIGVLENKQVRKLVAELQHIIELSEKGNFRITKEQEDGHTAIEQHLTRKLGELGKQIHTARSRNDQVLTALRLYYKDELNTCKELTRALSDSIVSCQNKYGEIKFAGYTHTRKAMPSSMAMWTGAFIESMADNLKTLNLAGDLVDQSPLGTGAGYGIPLEIDRSFSARELGFSRIQENPIYTQNSRGKFESTILHALSQIMFDLNKMATDLIFFTMPELGYLELPDEFCTGSSIMPQKKNPDVLELIRAKYHAVIACEFQIKNLVANLISGYNRDVQLTKEPTMQAFDITRSCLTVMKLIFGGVAVNAERCAQSLTREIYATQAVYELLKKGVPFRDAYKTIAKDY